jgi:hypothetical protein
VKVGDKDLFASAECVPDNGVGLDFSRRHGQVDADAVCILVRLKLFQSLKDAATYRTGVR